MRHETVIKRENGTQYQISIGAYLDNFRDEGLNFNVSVYTREKGKRKWNYVKRDIGEWQYRSLSMEDRREYDNKNLLKYVTSEEIYQAKLKLWESLKPKK